jgi:hypothetical protein
MRACAEAQVRMERVKRLPLGGPYHVHYPAQSKTYKLTSHALDARCLVGRKSARELCRNAAVVATMGAFVGLYLLKLNCPAELDGGPCPGSCWPGGGDCDMLWSPEADIATSIAGCRQEVVEVVAGSRRVWSAGETECGRLSQDGQAHSGTLRHGQVPATT